MDNSRASPFTHHSTADYLMVRCSDFTLQALTDAYNRSRVDYIVPMPMTEDRLRQYISTYDIDLTSSATAVDPHTGEILGIGMLGVRHARTWITRLGVLPVSRGRGVGEGIMDTLLAQSINQQATEVWLEVIAGNEPPRCLFEKLGFRVTRRLLVARRAPAPPPSLPLPVPDRIEVVDGAQAHFLLKQRPLRPNWLNEAETFQNLSRLSALIFHFSSGRCSWVVYEPSLWLINRVIIGTHQPGDVEAATAALHYLHSHFKQQDAIAENIPHVHPLWPAYQALGYFATFHRLEMAKSLP